MVDSDHQKTLRDTITNQLHWRYATKLFDASRKIPQADWDVLQESLRLAPSSYGLQPWKFVVVSSRAVLDKLVAAAPFNKAKFDTASHVVVIARRKTMTADYIDTYIKDVAQTRGIPETALQDYRNIMVNQAAGMSADVQSQWNSRQTYIALGSLLTTAALLGVDTCAMEGINASQFDEALGFTTSEYTTQVAVALGYRSADDQMQAAKKVRFAPQDVIVTI